MATAFARICFSLALQQEITTKTTNGYTKYSLTGFSSGYNNRLIDFYDKSFLNRTYYFTTDINDCRQRLMNNESDFSSILSYYNWPIPETRVSAPVSATQVSVMFGYSLGAIEEQEAATALTNFTLLENSVYFAVAAFLAIVALFVFTRALIHRHHLKHYKKLRGPVALGYCAWQGKAKKKKNTTHVMMSECLKEIEYSIDGTSERFRWISFLCSVLLFMVITAFYGVYSTSQIVVKEPEHVDSYKKLIEHKTALPIFYELFGSIADHFRDDTPNSMRGKIWTKLIRAHIDMDIYVVKKVAGNPRTRLLSYFERMNINGSVLLGTPEVLILVGSTICGSSPEDELWHMEMVPEESEPETLLGWPISINYPEIEKGNKVIIRIIESGLFDFVKDNQAEAVQVGWTLSGTSRAHLVSQTQACWAKYTPAHDPTFQNAMTYYESIALVLFSFCVIAFIILLMEIGFSGMKKRKRRSMARERIIINQWSTRH